MLNINKIESDFNKHGLKVTEIRDILNQPYTTVINKKKRGIWKPNDVEKFAKYFGRNINYYYDFSEVSKAEDPEITTYTCLDCIEKQKKLNELNELLKQKENELEKDNELIESQRKYINLLEEMQNIKGNRNCG